MLSLCSLQTIADANGCRGQHLEAIPFVIEADEIRVDPASLPPVA